MTDDQIVDLLMTLPAGKRREVLVRATFAEKQTLPIAKAMTDVLTKMAKLCGIETCTTMVDVLRDAADQIERPWLVK